MKQLTFLLTALFLWACNSGNDRGGSTIEMKIEGAGGKLVKFERYATGNQSILVDSVRLDDDGTGTLRLPPLPMDLYTLSLAQDDMLIVALDSTEDLKVEATAGSLPFSTLEGAVHSLLIHEFFSKAKEFEQRNDSLRNVFMTNGNDPATLALINGLNNEFYEYSKGFLQRNSASPAVLLVEGRVDPNKEFELLKQIRDQLRPVMPNSVFYQELRRKVDNQEQMQVALRMQEQQQQRMNELLAEGRVAPEIRQQTPDGDTFALSQLRGKYVLIDFWAAWCRPCRMENPAVKKVYDKYHRKGFEILGVSLDQSREAWVGAIQADGLPWKHVSDLGYWNNAAAQEYGVSSIPFTVLVDREGKVIAKGLRAHDLEAKLAEIFGS